MIKMPPQNLVPADREYLKQRQLWEALGPGPWKQRHEYEPTSLHEHIFRLSGGQMRDYGMLNVTVDGLVSLGFLTLRRDETGHLIYSKVSTPPSPDGRDWTQRMQAALDEGHRMDEELMALEEKHTRAVQQQLRELDNAGGAQTALAVQALHDPAFVGELRALIRAEIAAAAAEREASNG